MLMISNLDEECLNYYGMLMCSGLRLYLFVCLFVFSPGALMKQRASSPRPPSALVSSNTPKSRPKRAQTPVRVEPHTKTPSAVEQARKHHSEY